MSGYIRRPGWGTDHWLWEGGATNFFPLGYVLECNLMGLVSCSDILGTLVRLHFVKLRVATQIRA